MITRDEWLRAMEEAGVNQVDDRDALTPKELGELMGIERTTAERRVRAMVAAGKAIKTTKLIEDGRGRRYCHTAYKLVPAKKKR